MTTIKDIAEKAGVSIGTVDRVIHKRGRVSRETVKQVQKIIAESGYTTNIFARNLSLAKKYTFAVIMPHGHQDSGYWDLHIKGIRKAQDELTGYGITVQHFFYDRFSRKSFQQAAARLFKSKFDALLCAQVLPSMAPTFFAGITPTVPVALVDSDFPNVNRLAYIGQDSFQSGVLSGKLMGLLAKPGELAIIKPAVSDFHIDQRIDGIRHYCREHHPRFTFSMYPIERPDDSDLYACLMEKIFADIRHIRGIYVSDASAHNAAAYIEQKKLAEKIPVIGNDLIDKNRSYIEKGLIDFVISQKPEMQGYEGIYALYRRIVLNEPAVTDIVIPLEIITRENIQFYR